MHMSDYVMLAEKAVIILRSLLLLFFTFSTGPPMKNV